jgi:UDP-glucose 4-epimerase
MAREKVVVTGGAGFIGSNLAEKLAEDYEVVVLDNLSTGFEKNVPVGARFVQGSISDLGFLLDLFKGASCIFHLAALPSVQRSIDDPIATNINNINGTLNVLIAAKDCAVDKVVFASSSSVYGDTPTLPKKENMIPNPQSPYAVSKLAGEYYCRVFSNIYGLKTTCLRYFNVFGPRQNPNSEYAAVIPRFITRILNNEPPIIFGDGLHTRDFTFVKDVVKANILSMNSDSEGIFNIACARRISLNELASALSEIIGKDIDPIYQNPRPGDIKDSLADISMARQSIGYEPDFDMTMGLKETVEWFQKIC